MPNGQPLTFADCRIERLTADTSISSFDCGHQDLNDFLREDAKLHIVQLMATTFLVRSKADGTLVAYFSLSNDSMRYDEAAFKSRREWNKIRKKVPQAKRYRTMPAVKIGRLAVCNQLQRSGIGTDLMNYIKFWFTTDNKTGCRFIVVDAHNSTRTTDYYQKQGFTFTTARDVDEDTRTMHYDLMRFVLDEAQEEKAA